MNANLKALRGNLERIIELLDEPDIEKQYVKGETYMHYTPTIVNRSNVELRHRLAMLRRESVQFEKDIKKGES